MAIFEFLTVYIADIIGQVGYLGIFILMALESVCLPIPSEVVMTFGGFAAQRGDLNFWLVGLTGSLGCLAGSTIAYFIGYYGGRPFLKNYGKFVMIGEHDIDRADRWFLKYGAEAVFITRLLPIVRTFISIPAGMAKMSFAKFAVYSFAGSLPWCFALTYAGIALGKNWDMLQQYWIYLDVFVILVLAALAAYVLYHKFMKKRPNNEA
jgi:membrane protein DedA with SNARE-associated domain